MTTLILSAINGRSYGNLEGLDVCQNDDVMWHVLSFGRGDIPHGVTFNGNNVLIDGINRDSHMSVSGLAFTAIMHPDNVGMVIYSIFLILTLYVTTLCLDDPGEECF